MFQRSNIEFTDLLNFKNITNQKICEAAILSGKYNSETGIASFGCSDGFYYLGSVENGLITNKVGDRITESSIFDVCWLSNENLLIASGESEIYMYNIIKEKAFLFPGHEASIKSLKNKDSNIFYSGGRDGKVGMWDARICTPVKFLHSNQKKTKSITALEFNKDRDYILYAAETPGGNLDVFDMRYTKNGQIDCKQQQITRYGIISMLYKDYSIYSLLSNGSIIKHGESGSLVGDIINVNEYGCLYGNLMFNARYDIFICSTSEKVKFFDCKNSLNIKELHFNNCNGIFSTMNNEIIGFNNNGSIISFEIDL